MKSKRIQWLDFTKGFAIFFVVLAHWSSSFLNKDTGTLNDIIEIIVYLSYTFIMPIFFLISGYLYKHVYSFYEYILLIYKKTISLLLPYSLFSILFTLIHFFHHHDINSLYNLFLGYKYATYLWFIVSLFFIFIIIGLLDLIHLNIYIQIIIFLILTVIQPDFWLLTNNTHIYINLIYCTVSYALFFYLGIIMKNLFNNKRILNKIKSISHKKLFALIIVWMFIISIQSKFTISTYQVDFLTFTDAFTKFSIAILICLIFINLNQNKLFKYFTYYGKYTLIIYLIHMIFILLLEHTILHNESFIVSICGLIIIWTLSIFTCYLSKKFKLINFIFYPRRYINKLVIKTRFNKYLLGK